MELIVIGVALGLTIGGAIRGRKWWRFRGLSTSWKQLAGKQGLEFRPGSRGDFALVTGNLPDRPNHRVVIDTVRRNAGIGSRFITRVCVHSKKVPVGLVMEPQKSADDLTDQTWAHPFDQVTFKNAKGELMVVGIFPQRDRSSSSVGMQKGRPTAVLTSKTLARLGAEGEVRLTQGALTVELGGIVRDQQILDEVVLELSDLANLMSIEPSDTVGRLLENFDSEPDPEFRFRNLDVLLRHFSENPEALKAAERAVEDPDSWIRLLGSLFLSDFETAGRLLKEMPRDQLSMRLRLRATWHVKRAAELQASIPFLMVVLQGPLRGLQQVAVTALARFGHMAAVPILRKIGINTYGRFGIVVAKAITEIGGEEAEAALLGLIEHQDISVRMATISGLAEKGTVRAVEPLLQLTKGGRVDGSIKRAARAAIVNIQAKIEGAPSGGLSIAEATVQGGLSVVKEAGGLSVESPTASVSEDSTATDEKH